jgi:hypothetical protein
MRYGWRPIGRTLLQKRGAQCRNNRAETKP